MVDILNNDKILGKELGGKEYILSVAEFKKYNSEWSKCRNAEMFSIIHNTKAIGMISLSHQDIKQNSAQIGYWISSEYWGQGYVAKAFLLMLDFAGNKGIKRVSASIKPDNIASRRIWEKYGAGIKYEDNMLKVSLYL